jgi:hypothetical protein
MKRAAACIGAVSVAWAMQAAAADSLTVEGARLDGVSVAPATANVARTVTLNGDAPAATYVVAHTPDGKALQRTNLGYWHPWDGALSSLVDNGFRPAGDALTFKILKEDISGRFFPIRVTIAYRVGEQIKFGVFQIVPE